jgi:hypothetical protein
MSDPAGARHSKVRGTRDPGALRLEKCRPLPASLFFYTNVLVDCFFDRSDQHDKAGALVARAVDADVALCTSAASLKNVYFLAKLEFKRIACFQGD